MSTLISNNPTLLDLAKRTDPDGSIAAIVEVLNQDNEIVQDMTWQEGNLVTGHRSTIRTGIPLPTFRKMYGYVAPGKSTTAQVEDRTSMLEAYAEIDKALADLNGNTAAYRLSEEKAFIEGFTETVATSLFYANEATAPETFIGLAPRFNDSTAANGRNIIKGGGAGTDNASIWLVYWSPDTIFGIVPKGSKAGLQMKDLGEQTGVDVAGGTSGMRQVYRTHYRWDLGLCVRDWRGIVRMPNIDKSNLTPDASGSSANLPQLMFQMMDAVPMAAQKGRPVFYMSRQVLTALRQQTSALIKQSTLTEQNVGGVRVTDFCGVPIRRCDVLAADEALVS